MGASAAEAAEARSAVYALGGRGEAAAQDRVRLRAEREEGDVRGTNTVLEEVEEEVASSSNTHPLDRVWNSVPMAMPVAGDREKDPETGGT